MKNKKLFKIFIAAIASLTVFTNIFTVAFAENMYQNSDFIEKEQPELTEETKQLISLYQKNPTEENYINLREEVIKNYNAVLERKEQKLAELKSETLGKPGGDEIVAEMEDIVQDMYKTYWNRINSSMLRFTDTRLLKWKISDAYKYDYIPVMGAGETIYVSRTQVTNEMYAEFLKETGKTVQTYETGEENYPVNYVSVSDAAAYCDWLTQKDGKNTYRLPTESEWELAAGHMPKDADFNCGINNHRTSVYEYAEVTRGAHGAIDFWGNVWEWTSTVRDENKNTFGVKGGSWKSDRTDCRTEYREEEREGSKGYEDVGFRVIKVLNGIEPNKEIQLSSLENPDVTAASLSDDSITISWQPVNGANEYQIFEYFPDTDLVKMLNKTADTTITINGLKYNSEHSYIVQPISYIETADNVYAKNSVKCICGQNNNEIKIYVNGNKIDFSKYDNVFPVIENGRTLVPVRAVSEALSAEILWNNDTQKIEVKKDSIIIAMTIGNLKAFINGNETSLDTPPVIQNGRTLVPLRFIAEGLNLNVNWNEENKTIKIE